MKTWRKFLHSSLGKATALTLIVSLLGDIWMPLTAQALTGGPSQPEFQGFTELGVSDMVHPFTGDLKYEIPLMTVPGPNGGYPINLTYMAGPGMEDEASWVGLGWSLNPGAINRSMRGVPDDFSGPQEDANQQELVNNDQADHITKSFFVKNNVTVGIGVGLNFSAPEVGGADLSFASAAPNANLYYNTYKGLGFRSGVGLKLSAVSNEAGSGGLSANLNLSFDSNDGASAQPSLSFTANGNKMSTNVSYGFGYNSRQGITNTFLTSSISRNVNHTTTTDKTTNEKVTTSQVAETGEYGNDKQSAGNGISFAATSGVPSNSMAMAGFNTGFNLDFEAGALQTTLDIPVSFNGMLSVQRVKEWMKDGYAYPAYGTLYSGYRENGNIEHGRALMDYNRERDGAINMKTPGLPMPVMTHDVYTVTGAGTGGSFRAFRNDVGIFYEPRVASDFLGVTLGMEVAASSGFKVGVDPTVNFSHSYSGRWRGDEDIKQVTQTNYFRKADHLIQNGVLRTLEPFDFRFTGESTALLPGDNRFGSIGGNGARNYTLFPATAEFPNLEEMEFEDPDAQTQMNTFFPFKNLGKFKPKASNKMGSIPILSKHTVRKHRERKIQLVEYRTKKEIQAETAAGGTPFLPSIFVNDPSQVMPGKTAFNLSQEAIKGHHITEFGIVQPDGMRYMYGLPLYNRVHEEYYFAISPPLMPPGGPTTNVGNLASIMQNRKGDHNDKFFTSAKISPYVHAHLLTQIVSPDYVDVDNNGPSDADYGYWTKFNYHSVSSFKWRVPVKQNDVNYIEGYASSPNDDKGTFTYGERDMTYLHSVETRTHVAVFFVSPRQDSKNVLGVTGGVDNNSQLSQKLDRIELYAKNDLTRPLKTVYFTYTYELCQGIDNGIPGPGSGKLTLHSIHFQYGNSPKGALTPYVFEYGKVYVDASGAGNVNLVADPNLDGNPHYRNMDVDRWGNYKQSSAGLSNQDEPYVDQTEAGHDRRLESATAWNLTGITLPTGAKLKIAYEPDDYAYVQNREATQMYRIAGMGDGGANIDWLQNGDAQIVNDYKRVYFHLDNQNATVDDIKKMISQLPDGKIYFKTWQRLQIPKGLSSTSWVYDYVTGYAPIKTALGYGIETGPGSLKYGYVTLQEDPNGPAKAQNFFRKAGLQYLRYQRADLAMPQNQQDAALEAAAMILGIVPVIVQSLEMIRGYYNWATDKNHCKFIGTGKPSYIKLGCADGIKYGGGHRVRKITLGDAWSELSGGSSATYGMEYYYRTSDGRNGEISSGVASYEPLIGGEENPMKRAHYYGPDSKYIHNDPAFFSEEPFGEAYFPAPVVGYSKVITINLANRQVTKTGDGVRVNEFYTAKDFPIVSTFTPNPQRIEDKQSVFIPLVASVTLQGYGYSQGYYVELNDMHGKPKVEALYDADYWSTLYNRFTSDTPPCLSRREYHYKTGPDGKLDNTTDVLDADQQVRTAVMGESSEMFSEMKEDFSYSIGAGAQINGGVDPVPVGIFFTGFPNFEYNENSARILVTTKVVYKNGILDKVVDYSEGATKTTRNLLFDPETGAPLLTAVTGDFDNPETSANDQLIYNYTYPAHWYYNGMQAAYRNYRNLYVFSGSSSFPDADKYFEKGDELLSPSGARVWVKDFNTSSVSLVDGNGNPVTPNGTYVTLRSGKRNRQSIPTGALSSLKTPIGAYHNALLDFYNSTFNGNPDYNHTVCPGSIPEIPFDVADCANPTIRYEGTLSFNCSPSNEFGGPALYFSYTDPWPGSIVRPCDTGIPIPPALLAIGFKPSLSRLEYYSDTHVLWVYDNQAANEIVRIPVKVGSKCTRLTYCMDGVLNASADEFSDTWDYNGEFAPSYAGFAAFNDYRKGKTGIWRKLRANAYFADRKQTGSGGPAYHSFIGRDGTYENFAVFNWRFDPNGTDIQGNRNNLQANVGWRWQQEVTPYGYNPYGFEIETVDALGVYSAALYGYANSLPVAVAKNANYAEIGFDGFEEYAPFVGNTATHVKHGHLPITRLDGSAAVISKVRSHTGNYSLYGDEATDLKMVVPLVAPPGSLNPDSDDIQLVRGKKYVVGFWYYSPYMDDDVNWDIDVTRGSTPNPATPLASFYISGHAPAIDGWRRFEAVLDLGSVPSTDTHIGFYLSDRDGYSIYLDDIRIFPAGGVFQSFVYDPKTFLLRATLDDNNYAAFYNYDEENTLIQVKKETAEGIRTIQTTRRNVKIQPIEP